MRDDVIRDATKPHWRSRDIREREKKGGKHEISRRKGLGLGRGGAGEEGETCAVQRRGITRKKSPDARKGHQICRRSVAGDKSR